MRKATRKERREELSIPPGKATDAGLGKADLLLLRQLGQMLGIDRLAPLARLTQRQRLFLALAARTPCPCRALYLLAALQVLHQRHRRPAKEQRRKEHDDQRGRDDHVAVVNLVKLRFFAVDCFVMCRFTIFDRCVVLLHCQNSYFATVQCGQIFLAVLVGTSKFVSVVFGRSFFFFCIFRNLFLF